MLHSHSLTLPPSSLDQEDKSLSQWCQNPGQFEGVRCHGVCAARWIDQVPCQPPPYTTSSSSGAPGGAGQEVSVSPQGANGGSTVSEGCAGPGGFGPLSNKPRCRRWVRRENQRRSLSCSSAPWRRDVGQMISGRYGGFHCYQERPSSLLVSCHYKVS